MNNDITKKVTSMGVLKFTLPTICMMIFLSLYTMIDGVFVSRFVNTSALSGINIVFPVISFIVGVAIMLATGGSAITAIHMGEKKAEKAREDFSLVVVSGIVVGIIIAIIGTAFLEQIIKMLGANDAVYDYCVDYLGIIVLFAPLSVLQIQFQYFFVTAGKPMLGFIITALGGIANIVLDYVFIVTCSMGISGAAIATGIGYSIPAIFGLIYFFTKRKGTLYFVKFDWDKNTLIKSCSNGSSEMVTNLSMAITTFLFNLIMMKLLGEDGVAAITIVLYAQFFLTALFLGYSSGIAPLISYNYGKRDSAQLKKIFKISITFILSSSIMIFILSIVISSSIVMIFAKEGTNVYKIAKEGFNLFSICYLFMGINIFASAMFTALSDGFVSALISFLRTFVFLGVAIVVLSKIFGVTGVWISVPIAEGFCIVISVFYFVKLRKKYEYI